MQLNIRAAAAAVPCVADAHLVQGWSEEKRVGGCRDGALVQAYSIVHVMVLVTVQGVSGLQKGAGAHSAQDGKNERLTRCGKGGLLVLVANSNVVIGLYTGGGHGACSSHSAQEARL
jgi:hypothetical protein